MTSSRNASFFADVLTMRQIVTHRFAVITFALLGASIAQADTSDSAKAPLPVKVEAATPVDSILRERVYTGTLVARRRSALSFERAGKLVDLKTDEGERVEQGQLLASLDTRRLVARRAQAEADLAQASSVLRELIKGPRDETIAAAEAEVRNLAAQRDVSRRRLDRRAQLVESRAVSQEEYDDALFEFRAAEARVDVEQKQLDELLAGTRVEQVEAQRARVASLEARLADIKHEIEDAELRAPFAGRIAARRLDEGAVVAAGEAVFDLIEDDKLEAWVGAPPASAALVEPGMKLGVKIAGVAYDATVRSVRPELDNTTRTQLVVLDLHEPRGLVAGQVVRIGVREPVAMTGIWVPTAALAPDRRGLWSALVVDDAGKAAPRPVEIIENDGDRSFVRGALQPGERVIVGGAHRVVAGQRVAAASAP